MGDLFVGVMVFKLFTSILELAFTVLGLALKLAFWTIRIVIQVLSYLFARFVAYRHRVREQAEPTLEEEV
jgi:hypothetical protein